MNLGLKLGLKNGKNLLSQFHTDSSMMQSFLDKESSTSDLNFKLRQDRGTSATIFSDLPPSSAQYSVTAPTMATVAKKPGKKLNLTSDFLRKIKAYNKQ